MVRAAAVSCLDRASFRWSVRNRRQMKWKMPKRATVAVPAAMKVMRRRRPRGSDVVAPCVLGLGCRPGVGWFGPGAGGGVGAVVKNPLLGE